MYYLGIDAGGTKTRARLVDESGAVLGVGEAGAGNPRVGLDRALGEVRSAYEQALAQAGFAEAALGDIRAGLGIAGLSRRGVLAGLQAHPFPFRAIAFASDGAIANLGAHSGRDGAIVIVGTGSVGFGRVDGQVFTVGGYGFPLSDEGSGADLGLHAIRRSLWARDGRLPHSPMTHAVLARFNNSAGEIVDWSSRATATDYGGFAPLVMDHALAGDPVAEPIVQEAAQRIDRLIRVLLDRGASPCCLMGGLSERLRHWLSVSTREKLREPDGDALDGAVILARTKAPLKERH
jgi:glucosamine kinase